MEGTALRMRESLTPEQKVARRKRILRKFRAIVHLVMCNHYWLGELEETQLTENVRRNIRLLTKKKKVLSRLTMKGKAILCKPKEDRTDEDRAHLSKVIGGMKCFRNYPIETKRQLAACTYFVYFPPGRVIVKQDHPAHAMYFILSGEVKVSVSRYDKYLDEFIVEDTGILGPGSMFGDISLIHNVERVATMSTMTNCEFFMIKKEDFNDVIKETVLKSWTDIQKVLDSFAYFKNWDNVTKREASILTKIKHFAPEETILGEVEGLKEHVYFITQGTCCVVENLTVTVFCIKGIETYTLNPLADEEMTSFTLTNIFNKYKRYLIDEDQMSVGPRKSRYSIKSTVTVKSSREVEGEYPPEDECIVQNEAIGKTDSDTGSQTSSIEVSTYTPMPIPRRLAYGRPYFREEVHFVKVAELYAGGCFNIGERLRRRSIIALTPVSCLLIPRFYLMRNNKGNVWNMVQQYLNHHIPSTETIFKKFLEKKKFKKYSKTLIKDILSRHNVLTGNSIHNVPYSIRLREGVDTEYFNF